MAWRASRHSIQLLVAVLAAGWLPACGSASRAEPSKTPASEGSAASGARAPATASENRFEAATAGVSIEKLPSWAFMPLEAEARNREAVSVGNAETDAAMHDRATPPLVVIARYPEPSEKPNPTLKINLRPLGELGSASAVQIARTVADLMAKAIPSFELDGEVQPARVSDLDAGTFRAHFTIEVPRLGRSFRVKTQAWIVPRGAYGFIIAASDPSGGAEDYEADFQAMVATISIRK